MTKPILVIGATGKTGRRVAARLTAKGIPVKAASRNGQTHFEWNDKSTWLPALEGAGAAYITYYPDLAFPGAAETVEDFAKLAVANGVKRLVLLSGRSEEEAQLAEKKVKESGADYTLVRCAFFNQNFSELFAETVQQGVLAMPGGDTVEPFLDAEDIADVVTAALTDDKHSGELYELTGPRLMTLAEAAAAISEAMGRPLQYIPVTAAEYAEDLIASGLPAEVATPVAGLFAEVLDGRNSYLTDGVERALGRKPHDFADWARETAATGVWDRAEVA